MNRLARESSGGGRRIEVINAGVTGYQTFQHLVYLNEILWEYEPDWVIFLDGHNDFYSVRSDFNHWRDYAYAPAGDLLTRPSLSYAAYSGAKAAAESSNFAYVSFRLLHRGWRQKLIAAAAERIRGYDLTPPELLDSAATS